MKPTINLLTLIEQEVREILERGAFDPKLQEYVPPNARDLAALGNLVLNIQKRKDELESKANETGSLVAFPAMPANPNKLGLVSNSEDSNVDRFG